MTSLWKLRQDFLPFEALVAIFFSVLSAILAIRGVRIAVYPSAGLAIGAGLAWCIQSLYGTPLVLKDERIIAIPTFLLITASVMIAWYTSIGVPILFYFFMCIITLLLSFWALSSPSIYCSLSTILFAVGLRASYWYSAPVFGRDVNLHLEFTRYVVQYGEIIPSGASYYHFFPIGHLLAATIAEITATPARIAFFLSIGLAAVGGIVVVSKIVPRVIWMSSAETSRAVSLTMIYLAIAPYHILYSSSLIAQSLMLLYVPLSIIGLMANDHRLSLISLLSAGVLLITHNIPGLALAVFAGIFVLINRIGQKRHTMAVYSQTARYIPIIISLGIVEYWAISEIFDLQFARITRLFSSGGSLAKQSVVESTMTSIWSNPLLYLSTGLILGGACFFGVGIFLVRKVLNGEKPMSYGYYISALILFAGFGVALVIGLDTNIIRLIPLAPIFAAPIAGFILAKIGVKGPIGVIIVVMFLTISPVMIFASAAGPGYSPGDAPTETRPGQYRLFLSESDLANAELATQVTQQLYTSTFVADALQSRKSGLTDREGIVGYDVLHEGWNSSCTGSVYVRDYYHQAFNFQVPQNSSTVLDTGTAKLQLC